MNKNWFDLHLPDKVARTMSRKEYYAARSWLRNVRRIQIDRYKKAYINPDNPREIIIPAHEGFKPNG